MDHVTYLAIFLDNITDKKVFSVQRYFSAKNLQSSYYKN